MLSLTQLLYHTHIPALVCAAATHREELSAQGLGLLPDSLTCVKHAHDGPHALCAPDGSQAGHAPTNDQHLGGRHLAGCCDLAREEAPKVVGSLNHSPAGVRTYAHTHSKGEQVVLAGDTS